VPDATKSTIDRGRRLISNPALEINHSPFVLIAVSELGKAPEVLSRDSSGELPSVIDRATSRDAIEI